MVSKIKRNAIMIILIIAIIGTILAIEYIKDRGDGEEGILKCIASKSVLYSSKTCSHCANQKLILGSGLQYFTLIDCADEAKRCADAGILGVPAWEIDGKMYGGVKTIEQLKELTGC